MECCGQNVSCLGFMINFRSCLPLVTRLQLLVEAKLGAHNGFLGAEYVLASVSHLAFSEMLLLIQRLCVQLACVSPACLLVHGCQYVCHDSLERYHKEPLMKSNCREQE